MNVFDLAAKITLDSSEYTKNLDSASTQTNNFSDKLKTSLGTAGKIAVGVVTAVASAVVALSAEMAKGIQETAAYGDNIDKMSQKMGISAQAYQEWDFVLQHAGSSMESMKASMKTLANAAESNNEAFQRLGITQEQMANMTQEELFGAVISGLQNVEDTTERTYLAGQLLGRGATELGALLNMSAEETEAMREQVHELGGVMSDEAVKASASYADSLQNLKYSINGLSRNTFSEFLPAVVNVMDGLTQIFSGDPDSGIELITNGIDQFMDKLSDLVPKIIKLGSKIITSLMQAITKNLPKVIKGATETVLTFIQSIIQMLPKIINAGIQIIKSLVKGIAKALPDLIPAVIDMINEVVISFLNNIGEIVEIGIAIIKGIVSGIIKGIPELVKAAPRIIGALFTGIIEAFTSGIGGLIGELLGGFNLFNSDAKQIWDSQISSIQLIQEEAQKAIESVQSMNEERVNTYDSLNAEIGLMEDIKNKMIEYTDEQGHVKEGYEDEMIALVNLAEAQGIHIDVVDGEIQGYSDLITSIDDAIRKRKEEAITAAETQIYEEAYKKRRDLDSQYREHYQNYLNYIAEADKARIEGRDADADTYMNLANEEMEATQLLADAYVENTAQMELASYNMTQAASGNFDDLATTYDQAGIDINNFKDEVKKTNDGIIYDYEKTFLVRIPDAIKQGNHDAWYAMHIEAISAKEQAKYDYYGVYSYAVDGMEQALYDGKSRVINAATDVMRSAIKATESVAQIKSPSRVFKRIGTMLDEGLVVGVEGSANKVLETVSDLQSNVNKAIDNVSGKVDIGVSDTMLEIQSNKEKNNDQVETLLSNITMRLDNFEQSMYDAISAVLADGFDLRWNDRELTRLVREHA